MPVFPMISALSHWLPFMWHWPSSQDSCFTVEELQSHHTADDAWVAIDGIIYDVSQYHESHPGGDLLLGSAGRDISDEFHVIHNQSSRSVLYRIPRVGTLTSNTSRKMPQEREEKELKGDFATWATSRSLPCVGAKIAFSRGSWDLCMCRGSLGTGKNAETIAESLKQWSVRQEAAWSQRNYFTTFIALFPDTPLRSDLEFEDDMFAELRSLMALDTAPWPADMPKDPSDPGYYFSVFGASYFVVGLHPSSCRPGRRFKCAALVFNLKRQFDQLHKTTEFDDLSKAIRKRDTVMSGGPNPNIVADLPILQQSSGYDHTKYRIGWYPDL